MVCVWGGGGAEGEGGGERASTACTQRLLSAGSASKILTVEEQYSGVRQTLGGRMQPLGLRYAQMLSTADRRE